MRFSRRKKRKLADLLCGAGGTSTGAIQAVRLLDEEPVLKGFNHWPQALRTHHMNYPDQPEPCCANIDEVNPRDHYKRGELDGLLASPECRFHSNARGGRPINEQQRPTAFCVPRWLEAAAPTWALVENVPEFLKWGRNKNGEAFKAWFNMCCALGYWGAYRVFNCADYGAPTTRRRLIVQFVKKGSGLRITWPDAHHFDTQKGPVPAGSWAWKDAEQNVIDWSVKGRWLDEMPGKKQFGGLPISPKTLARVYSGFEEHSGATFLVPKDSFGDSRTRGIKRPLHTIGTTSRGEALVRPFIVPGFGERKGQRPRVHSIRKPMPAITAEGHSHLLEPYVVEFDNQSTKNGTRAASRPLSTITTKARHSVVEPYLVELRGTSKEQVRRSNRSLREPLPTITAGGGHLGLVKPYVVQPGGPNRKSRSVARPLQTILPRDHATLIEPWLFHTAHGGKRSGLSVRRPLPTIAGNRGDISLCEAALLPQSQGGKLRSVKQPVPTIATAGAIALLEAYLVKYYGSGGTSGLKKPIDTITTKDRFALVCPEVVIEGKRARVRFRWRMLQPHELSAGQGFPHRYHFAGNKSEQTKQIGNAVPPALARSLVLAILTQKTDVRPWVRKFKEAA